MTDPIIQKLYNLNSEDLSYVICTAVFGYADTHGLEKSQEMRQRYRTEIEIKPEQKFIVKTYDKYRKHEYGEAFVLIQEFKDHSNVKNLIVVAENDYYVDLSQFKLGDIIPADSKDYFMLVAARDRSNSINFFAKDYSLVDFSKNASDTRHGPYYIAYGAAADALENRVWLDISRKFYDPEWRKDFRAKAQSHTTLNYIKADVSGTAFAAVGALTRSKDDTRDSNCIVNITFIPHRQAEMLLFGK